MHVVRKLTVGAADENQRTPLVVVNVRIPHRRAVDDEALVEQRRVAVLDRLELLQEVRQQAHVIPIDLREVRDVAVFVSVVRRGMEALRDTALGIHAARRVAAHLERKHAGDVGLERQRLQIEHQLGVLLERLRHADGPIWNRETAVVRLGLRDALLHVADGVEVLTQFQAVVAAEALP